MCGRYAASRNPDALVEEFEVDATSGEGPGEDPAGHPADFNVAPTKPAPVVLERPPRPVAGAVDRDTAPDPSPEPAGPVRWMRLLTWGLVPSWAKDPRAGGRMINSRAETMLDRPAYRRAALTRRCLVPADGWYEWQVLPGASGARPRRQPFLIRPADGDVAALAGVYEFWRDASAHPDDPSAWLTTFAVVTTEAEEGLRGVHDRMPLVLPRDRWDTWLDPEVRDPDSVRALLEPPPAGRFAAVAVSTRVNNVAHNGPELVEPVPLETLPGVVDPATGELMGGPDVPLF